MLLLYGTCHSIRNPIYVSCKQNLKKIKLPYPIVKVKASFNVSISPKVVTSSRVRLCPRINRTRISLFSLLGQQRCRVPQINFFMVTSYEKQAAWRGPATVARWSVDVVSLFPPSILRGCSKLREPGCFTSSPNTHKPNANIFPTTQCEYNI